jgi:predicted metal-dependent hydrolase
MRGGDRERRTSLVIAGREMPLVVRRHPRARRLTLRLPVGHDGVLVIIPERAAFADGVALARKNSAWIADRVEARPGRVAFADGAVFPLRGIEHEIGHLPDAVGRIRAEAGRILIGGAAESLAARLDAWLLQEARRDLAEEVARLASRLDRPVGRIGVRDTRSRWGSCAGSGNLSFSWRLILAPPFVLDYVAAHEVAHLLEMNHGPRFWKLVAKAVPRLEEAKEWLRNEGSELHRYGVEHVPVRSAV